MNAATVQTWAPGELSPKRAVLKYHGGKWMLAPWIISFFPGHKTYVEPYAGGAGVLMRKKPSPQEVYNDLDAEVVNVFRVLQDPESAKELERLLRNTPHARAEYDLSFEPCACPVESARRAIIRAFMGHGTGSMTANTKHGFRVVKEFNTSPGKIWSAYHESVLSFTQRLKSVTLECLPALEVIKKYDSPGTLFYVDPPYVRETRNYHGDAYRYEMTDDEHEELARALFECKGFVIVSGYDCELYQELYGSLDRKEMPSKSSGGWRTESLWLSPQASEEISRKDRQALLPIQGELHV